MKTEDVGDVLGPMREELTPEQQHAVEAFAPVYRGKHRRLTIGGYAGTGKTTIIRAIVDEYGTRDLVVCTPTGKAAHVLRSKGVDACTLHSLIYTPRGVDPDTGEVIFKRNGNPMPRVVIVDEASMLDVRLVKDLESLVKHVLYVGDHGQLEPIGDDPGLMRAPDIRLETIHRQAEGSPIVAFAHHVRLGHAPETFGPEARVQEGWSQDLADFDVVIVGFNESRRKVNAWMRGQRGFSGPLPQVGEQIICLRNNADYQVWNGMTATVRAIDWARRCMDVDTDDGPRENVRFDPEQFGKTTTLPYERPRKGQTPVTLWDFGYSVTAHKCVGGETLVETNSGWQRIDSLCGDAGDVATIEGPQRYTAFIRKAEDVMLTLNCENGYRLRVTPDHRMRTYNSVTHEWDVVNAGHLTQGAWLRLRLGAAGVRPSIPRLPAMPVLDVRARSIDVPQRLTSDLAEFLGLMVGDGTRWRTGVRLAKRYGEVVDRFAALGNELFGLTARRCTITGTPAAEFHSVALSQWLAQVGGMNPHAKAIPAVIMQAPRKMRAAFLRGLFEDGTVNIKDGVVDHIEFTNCGEALVRVVQTLLLEFGIISTVTVRARATALYIYGDGITIFKKHIGFVANSKNERLNQRICASRRWRVPIDAALLPVRYKSNAAGRGYISRASAAELGLHDLLSYHYVRLLSVETGRDKAYCLHVPEGGSFLQNRFDGMNSQGSEWGRVAAVDEVASSWSGERWRYTSATRASQQLRWVYK